MKTFDIYSLGNALVDLEFEVTEKELQALGLPKNVMTLINEEQHHQLIDDLDGFKHAKACGGSGANSIAAAQVLGAKTYFTCCVGDDASGDFFYQEFRNKGVVTNLTEKNRTPAITGKCIVLLTPDTERTMCTFLGVADQYTARDIDRNALMHSTFLYAEGYAATSTPSRLAVIAAQKIARENGVLTALSLSDPNVVMHARHLLIEMMYNKPDILFSNRAEALLFCQTDDIDEAKEHMKRYAKTFAITLGKYGSVTFDGEAFHYSTRYPTTPVDTLGAGDTFAGAFLYALSKGYSYKKANELANIAGGVIVSKFGPRIDERDATLILEKSKMFLMTADV